MKIGDKYFVKETQGIIVEIGYQKNSSIPVVVLVQFPDFSSVWIPVMALKSE